MDTHVEYDENNQSNGQALAPRQNEMVRRDFGGVSVTRQSGAIEAMAAKERAMIEARWTMALHRPRNIDNVRQDIIKECRRPGFAEVAIYERPVGRKKNEKTGEWEEATIEGLSIRFAEVAARCMTNLSVETQTVHDADEERRVRVTVTDLESNGTWSRDLTVRKTVERKFLKKGQRPLAERVNSYGDRVFIVEATDDEVGVKEAAAISKAARTLILRLVPGHLQDEAMAICKKVAADRDAKDPDAARNRVLDAFAGLSIKPSDLEQLLGHSTEQLTPAEIERLRKLYAAISSDEMTWQEALDGASSTRKEQPKGEAKSETKSETKPAESKPEQKPEQTASSPKSGKGNASVKDKLKTTEKPPANQEQPKQETKPEPKAEEKKAEEKPATEPTPEKQPKLMSERDGYHERKCAKCGVPIECKVDDPPGAQCYACSQS